MVAGGCVVAGGMHGCGGCIAGGACMVVGGVRGGGRGRAWNTTRYGQ